jgi:hypothetical protein
MYRINVSLEKKHFDKLLKINLTYNYGIFKIGTFCRKIILDFINENDCEKDIQSIDGVKFKQMNLFNSSSKLPVTSKKGGSDHKL